MSENAYVTDVPYTWSFFNYQSPELLSFVARLNGYNAPRMDTAFTYLDLGCGNGVTANLLADAMPSSQFYGCDFNAEHIENAENFATLGGWRTPIFVRTVLPNICKQMFQISILSQCTGFIPGSRRKCAKSAVTSSTAS